MGKGQLKTPFRIAFFLLFLVLGFWMMNAYFAPPDFTAYYSHIHTLLTDRDLDFWNEYEQFGYEKHMLYITQAGYISNDWPLGTGLVWSLFYKLGDVIAWITGAAKDGFSLPYKALVLVGILFYVGCGLYASFVFLEKRFAPGTAFLSVLVCFFGTPLLFYTYYGGLMSHATGFFFVTCFLILWAGTIKERDIIHWILLGLLWGIIASIRPQHLVCMIVLPAEFLIKIRDRAFPRETKALKEFLVGSLLLVPSFLFTFLPQMILWRKIYGSTFQFPKLEEMHWFNPALYETFFSDYHGILPWTPLVLLGALGLYFVWKKDRIMGMGFALCLVAQIYIDSANEVWWAGGSFGNRRLTEYSFILMLGLCGLIAEKKRRYWIIPALLFAGWSFLLVVAERLQILTLEHYVAWDSAFFKNLGQVLATPGNWPGALFGNFAGLSLFGRCLAGFFLGVLLFCVWYVFENRLMHEKTPLLILLFILAAYALLNCVVVVSSHRTLPFPWEKGNLLYRSNRFLWNNYYEYGYYLLRKDRAREALEAYEKARSLIPERPQPCRYIGSIYEAWGNYEKAEEYYQEALKLDPNYERAKILLEDLQKRRKRF